MKKYEIESVEGVGYLLFEKIDKKRTKRIGEIFQNIAQAKGYLDADSADIQLVVHCAYEEMINSDEHKLLTQV